MVEPVQLFLIILVTVIASVEIWFGSPIVLWAPLIPGTLIGFILGDPVKGVITAGILTYAFLGVVQIGAAIPPDPIAGGITATAIVILEGLPPEAAVPIAYPVAILSQYLCNLAQTFDVTFVHIADRIVEKGETKYLTLVNSLGLIPWALARTAPVIAFVTLGSSAVEYALTALPPEFWSGLSAAGALMTTLGIAILLDIIWSPRYIPMFFLGFGFAAYLELGFLAVAFIGTGLIGMYYVLSGGFRREGAEEVSEPSEEVKRERKLTDADLRKVFWRSWLLQHSLNFERMEALGYLVAILPALKKLHPDKEELKVWLKTHLEFFNTTPYTATPIMGIDLAMEEAGADPETVSAIKTALMGPLAGIGDPVYWFTLATFSYTLGASFAIDGHLWAPIIPLIIWIPLAWGSKYWMLVEGYRRGMQLVEELKEFMEQIKDYMSAFAIMMLGAMIVAFVNIVTPIELIQVSLDLIIPKAIPLAFVFFTFSLLRRKISVTKTVLILFTIGIVLGYVGIIGPG
ncbi:MAG: PTS system mannose/fructose/sorbose family transporter subunit IID [Candidatus Asgardarchaeia archaeon]